MKISIVTAVFNARDTVAHALTSVRMQSHPDIEHIVIDGMSTDGTLDVLQSHKDTIAVLISEKDNGVYDALNKGIARATGDLIGFLHADDELAHPNVLARIAAVFAERSVDACYGDLVYVHGNTPGKLFRYWNAGRFSRRKMGWGWMPPHPTLYARRQLYDALGSFDTSYRIAADYDWMLRILRRNELNIAYIPDVLVRMRVGGLSNRSLKNILRKSREDYRALRGNSAGGLATLACKNLRKLPQFFT